ncbi:MAG: MBL fold metallo-hydrolase [Candidatus Omnitrophota bacterium]
MSQKHKNNFIKFLGTAGARFVMIKQLRASGGIWISCGGVNLLVDPGPGSIVRCAHSKPKLDPCQLDGILLTHRHLDHSSDINVMIEAMTEGGFKKRGVVFCPEDGLKQDSVILRYAIDFPEKIEILKADEKYSLGEFEFMTSMRHIHPAETYGIKFKMNGTSVSILTDTRYFKELEDFYKTDLLIISVVFAEPRPGVDHLSVFDARMILCDTRPKKAVLTHFGMTMLKAGPRLLAERLSKETGTEVVAAYDGMTLNI